MSKKPLTVAIPDTSPPSPEREKPEKMVTGRSLRQMKQQGQPAASPDVVIEEELSTPMAATLLAVDDNFGPYTLLDLKQELDCSSPSHRDSLTKIGLLNYAQLPWKQWKHNPTVSSFLLHIQRTKGNICGGYWLTPELVGAIFKLHVQEDNQIPKATDDMMGTEFGQPQGDRNYYPIGRIQDPHRNQQIKWFVERVCVLVKLEYISKENYAILRATEQGRKIGWANLLYIRLNTKLYQKKKRKDRTSKIGPFLTALHHYATGMTTLMVSSPHFTPNMHQSTINKDGTLSTTTSTSQETEQEKIIRELRTKLLQDNIKYHGLPRGQSSQPHTTDVQWQNLDLNFDEDIHTLLTTPQPTPQEPTKIFFSTKPSLKLKRKKLDMQGTETFSEVTPTPTKQEKLLTTFANEASLGQAYSALEMVKSFIGQEQVNFSVLQREKFQLQTKIAKLEKISTRSEKDAQLIDTLEEIVSNLEEKLEKIEQSMRFYKENLQKRESTAEKMKEWRDTWLSTLSEHIDLLDGDHAKLQAENSLLLSRVKPARMWNKNSETCLRKI
ncbi:hypothetical protein GOP47_0018157 [Adiantum capillus-veneris]|uniref:Uncharacterized protein n=1 Tax=Adiantum capillus-veneris TaxID=13818 RepID=A0A9D4ZAD0_ADICA|nr:hypothetical protein GOP47_0018157 [Adiantum capillus-veneris]